jgi:hypothetical protein
MAKARYTVLVGFDHGDQRAEVGDVIDWLPSKVADQLVVDGVLEESPEAPKKKVADDVQAR